MGSSDAFGTGNIAVVNARVWTAEPSRPWVDAVSAVDGRVALVGSSAEVRKSLSAGTRVIDAGGALVVPGLTDSHVHFVEGGLRLSWVQLAGCASRMELTRRIAEFATDLPPGHWILGGDWDHESWGGELPRAEWIDSVSPAHPVWVTRHDGHMGLANSLALKLAGVGVGTGSPDGGRVVTDADGVPTGVLKDKAMALVAAVVPPPSSDDLSIALDKAMKYVASMGVTSVHNMGTWENLAVFDRAHSRGELRTRIYAAVPLRTWDELRDRIHSQGKGDEWLRTGGLKEFVDGSLGSHTALFSDEYSDMPGESGVLVTSPEELLPHMVAADKAGLQCITHAIGDKANQLLLDVYEMLIRTNGIRDRRQRVEHAQHLRQADIPRFAATGTIASVQPLHLSDDGRWAERAIGPERMRTTYAFGSLQRAGAALALGSDWFVAAPDPLRGIHAAVTRQTFDGRHPHGWVPEEKISVSGALRGYTTAAAHSGFAEQFSGSLVGGKVADMVVIDQDITRVPADEIAGAAVLTTIVGGEVVFEA